MEVETNKAIGDYEGGETLFWKVMNNKYLLNVIIRIIKTTEWVRYEDYFNINAENRWSFESVYSFDWLVLKKQYGLLKNKIQFDDFILFDKASINVLFKELSILNGTLPPPEKEKPLRIVKEVDEVIKKEKIKQESSTLTELFKMILDKKRIEFEICDLTKSAVKNNCVDAIKILINEPYSVIVYPSTIELAIEKCCPQMVKELLSLETESTKIKSNVLLNEQVLKRSLKLASLNDNHRLEMVKLILDNSHLYIARKQEDLETEDEQEEIEENDLFLENDEYEKRIEKKRNEKRKDKLIEYYDFYSLGCLKTMKKLVDLNMVKLGYSNTDFKISNTFEELLLLIEFHFKSNILHSRTPKSIQRKIDKIIKNKKEISQQEKLKELQKLVCLEIGYEGEFYNQYIIKYDESIDDIHNDGLYSFENDGSVKNAEKLQQYINESKLLSILRYISINSYLEDDKEKKKKLKESMLLIRKNKTQWFPILKYINSNKDKLAVDWLIDCKIPYITSYFSNSNFETFEIWEYYNSKVGTTFKFNEHKYSFYLKAIKECNIEIMKKLDIENEINASSFDFVNLGLELPSSKEDVQKLVDYYSEKQFEIPENEFIPFYEKVVEVMPPSSIKLNSIDFDLAPALLDSIFELNFKIVELILLNVDEIVFTEAEYDRMESVERNLFNSELSLFHNDEDLIDFDELYSLIKFMIEKFSEKSTTTSTATLSEPAVEIVNYFFQMLLQKSGTKISEIEKVHQLFQDHSIELKHSLFNSFYYLQNRSAKFTKYIMGRPGIETFFTSLGEYSYNSSMDYNLGSLEGFDLKTFLDIDVFTYDFVFGRNDVTGEYNNSFDQVLYQLVHQLSITICHDVDIVEDFFQLCLNADLEYCLDIGRIDLFFKQLKFIEKDLEETTVEGYIYEEENPNYPIQEFTYNTPATTLKPTSMLFEFKEQPIMPPFPQKESNQWAEGLEFPPLRYINTFKFSSLVLDLVVMKMNVDQIQQFMESSCNWHRISFQSTIFSKSVLWSEFEITKFILDNYEVKLFSFPHFNLDTHYSYYLEFKYFIENHYDLVKDSHQFKTTLTSFNDFTFPIVLANNVVDCLSRTIDDKFNRFIDTETRESLLDELIPELREKYGINDPSEDIYYSKEREDIIQTIIVTDETQQMLKRVYTEFKVKIDKERIIETEKHIKEHHEEDDNMFVWAFEAGDIKICQLMLHYYPKQFKITKHAIKQSIKAKKINVIKFYYKNQNPNLIINLIDDKPMLDFLKLELSIHKNYKFDLDWLK